MSISECPFCALARNPEDADREVHVNTDMSVISFEPLNPVTPGHRLFVPKDHVLHPAPGPVADAMWVAEQWGDWHDEQFNLITSSGSDATQTVPHIHVHYVPRRDGDGLALPWTGQEDRHVDQ